MLGGMIEKDLDLEDRPKMDNKMTHDHATTASDASSGGGSARKPYHSPEWQLLGSIDNVVLSAGNNQSDGGDPSDTGGPSS